MASVLPGRTVVADRSGGEVQCDLTDFASLAAVVEGVDQLDSLVITAEVSPGMADARTILDVDLAGMARGLAAFDHLVRPGAVAVCVASMAGHLGVWPEQTLQALDEPLTAPDAELTDDPATAYALAKTGVLRLVRRMAPIWGDRGGRLVSVSPGVVDTPMGRLELSGTGGTSSILERCPLGRIGRPEEVASVIRFLCSDEASYITGTDLLMDGGTVAVLV